MKRRKNNAALPKDIESALKQRRKARAKIVYIIRETLPKAAAEIPKAAAIPKTDVLDKLNTLIASAFGLVAALAWNSAIQKLFETQPQLKSYGPWAYAVTVTIIAVIVTVWLGRLASAAKGKKEEEKKAEGEPKETAKTQAP